MVYKFIELFAGIGGFRIGCEKLKNLECVFASEWDKYAQLTYKANFNTLPYGDINLINIIDIPDHDILTAGFPCQPFSLAGSLQGFNHPTQGNLFFQIAEVIKNKQPKVFILENVKNLIHHNKGKTFHIIKTILEDELKYNVFYKIIDAKYFVPQSRKRIYIVGFKNNTNFEFPVYYLNNPILKIKDILETNISKKYTLSDNLWEYLQKHTKKHKDKGNGFGYTLVDLQSFTRTLSARYYKDGSEILIPQINNNPRKLTPRECARLMGFNDKFIIPVSDTQAYKQFGNAVVPPLIKMLITEILNYI